MSQWGLAWGALADPAAVVREDLGQADLALVVSGQEALADQADLVVTRRGAGRMGPKRRETPPLVVPMGWAIAARVVLSPVDRGAREDVGRVAEEVSRSTRWSA